jgi:predicted metal-binding protein
MRKECLKGTWNYRAIISFTKCVSLNGSELAANMGEFQGAQCADIHFSTSRCCSFRRCRFGKDRNNKLTFFNNNGYKISVCTHYFRCFILFLIKNLICGKITFPAGRKSNRYKLIFIIEISIRRGAKPQLRVVVRIN